MKLFLAIFTSLSSYFYLKGTALAVGLDPCVGLTPPFKSLCDITGGNLSTTIGRLIQAIFVIAAIIALFYLIYGGIKWITSEGDKEKVANARRHIIAALLGLIIVFLSYFLLSIILGLFGISFTNLVIPTISPTL